MKYEDLADNVKREVDSYLEFQKKYLVIALSKCESPIEQLFFIHFRDGLEGTRHDLPAMDAEGSVRCSPQAEIKVGKKKYRADFLVTCLVKSKEHKFVIECDGHDFHEKTKAQAMRDKARERNLINDGYTVLRFTGSEIVKNPIKCAIEAVTIIENTIGLKKFFEELVKKEMGY